MSRSPISFAFSGVIIFVISVSRFYMGLAVGISEPNNEMLAQILEKKLSMEQLDLPKEIKEFILDNFGSSVRDIEGALNKIIAGYS